MINMIKWMNNMGITVYNVKYRCSIDYLFPIPFLDGIQAIKLVKQLIASSSSSSAAVPPRIGVMGFSAGGHLAAAIGTLFDDERFQQAGGGLTGVSAKPDFMILIYPVISMEMEITHVGSRNFLLGSSPNASLVKLTSPHLNVKKSTPRTLILHGGRDKLVKVQNSLMMYGALLEINVEVDLHVFGTLDHGFSLLDKPVVTKIFEEWVFR